MKPYGLPEHEWSDEYAPTTRHGHGNPMRSRAKRELRRIAKKQKRLQTREMIRMDLEELEDENF